MATNTQAVEQLEKQAQRERERLGRHVAEMRQELEERLDLRRIAEDRIRARPAAFYGAAAAIAALVGYLFARLLKA
jgi:ElaB/YqjD/DUF883 family membrane-anchored ribosome-binding protein